VSGKNPLGGFTTRIVLPVVSRDSKAACASAASDNGYERLMRGTTSPTASQPNTSPARLLSSAGLAMKCSRRGLVK
jgi:hypothetical protein